jgi:hypothetical protein
VVHPALRLRAVPGVLARPCKELWEHTEAEWSAYYRSIYDNTGIVHCFSSGRRRSVSWSSFSEWSFSLALAFLLSTLWLPASDYRASQSSYMFHRMFLVFTSSSNSSTICHVTKLPITRTLTCYLLWLTTKVTNSSSIGQDIPHFLRSVKVHYRVDNCPQNSRDICSLVRASVSTPRTHKPRDYSSIWKEINTRKHKLTC